MWEITLVGEKQDLGYFLLLEEMLLTRLKNKPIIAIASKENLFFSIAVSDKRQYQVIKKCILEIAIRICKEEYFRENLNLFGSDVELNGFILMSLVLIGIQEELDYAIHRIKLTKNLHIRSLIRFRLSKLYMIWNKVIKYFQIILSAYDNEERYLQFLRFLAENSDNENEVLYLDEVKNNINIKDNSNKIISSIPKTDEIGIIVNLIIFSPKKVIINCYKSISEKTIELIKYIFKDKVCLLL